MTLWRAGGNSWGVGAGAQANVARKPTIGSKYDGFSSVLLNLVGEFEGILWKSRTRCDLRHKPASKHGIVMQRVVAGNYRTGTDG
jgi:hypothetical protein